MTVHADVSMLLEYGNGTSITVTFEESLPAAPTFTSKSLVLSGKIGVNFFVSLPGDVTTYENSYMASMYHYYEKAMAYRYSI